MTLPPGLDTLLTVAEPFAAQVAKPFDAVDPRDILRERGHRPWPLPDEPWMQYQSWQRLLFAHWAVDAELVRPLIPPPLELDLRDGSAWIAITPFVVHGARLRGTPPVPGLAKFCEINVRTYVHYAGKPGIWFFSLDADSRAVVAGARRTHRLPYFRAEIDVETRGHSVRYSHRRVDSSGPPAAFSAEYRPTGEPLPIRDGSLERWLAERYRHYIVTERGEVLAGEIHHPPWPLRPAEVEIGVNEMGVELGLDLSGPPLVHFAHRQDTLLWGLLPP